MPKIRLIIVQLGPVRTRSYFWRVVQGGKVLAESQRVWRDSRSAVNNLWRLSRAIRGLGDSASGLVIERITKG